MRQRRAVVGVDLQKVVQDLRPVALALVAGAVRVVRVLGIAVVGGHAGLAADVPHQGIAGVARHHVAVVLLHLFDAQLLHVEAPRTGQQRNEAGVDDGLHLGVRGIVEIGVDARPVRFPAIALFIPAAAIVNMHVAPQAVDDLDDAEALFRAVFGEILDLVLAVDAAGEDHPPRVAQPEEGLAVFVHQVMSVGHDADLAVLVQGIVARIGADLQFAAFAVQALVLRVGANALPGVAPDIWSRETHAPIRAATPEGRNFPLIPLLVGEDNIQFNFVEGVLVRFLRSERPLQRHAPLPFRKLHPLYLLFCHLRVR